MVNIFVVRDCSGRLIHLSHERWKHIVSKHYTMSNAVEKIRNALVNPVILRPSKSNTMIVYYYLWEKEKNSYVMVLVKYLNGSGFVITSFQVDVIR
ncbi:MAG TPA: hypothetical protein VJB87_03025 [Candidatus Nanoarchaeia archaeon]|nr:hypothetical protein [Candidatus Nanoarchaeia archaeon]